MKTIGIRELKAHLSRVLRDVGAGEVFLVTDRGRVVAELKQPGLDQSAATGEDRALARLAAAGSLRIGEPAQRGVIAAPRLLDEALVSLAHPRCFRRRRLARAR